MEHRGRAPSIKLLLNPLSLDSFICFDSTWDYNCLKSAQCMLCLSSSALLHLELG